MSLPRGISELLQRDPLRAADLEAESTSSVLRLAQWCWDSWADLAGLPRTQKKRQPAVPASGQTRDALGAALAYTFDVAARTLLKREGDAYMMRTPPFDLSRLESWAQRHLGTSPPSDPVRDLLTQYTLSLALLSATAALRRHAGPLDLSVRLGDATVVVTHPLASLALSLNGVLRQSARRLADTVLERQLLLARDHSWLERYEQTWLADELHLGELPDIAARTAAVRGRYGDHKLAKRLEHQLAVLMQTLGFAVLRTRTGTRTVDLTCLGTTALPPFSFILEAKSTAQPYALPTDDERALVEYVADTRAVLTALPLRLVILAGPVPSARLTARLQALERRVNVPVRFVRIEYFVALRKALGSAVVPEDWLDVLLGSDHIVGKDFAGEIARRDMERKGAYEDLARRLLRVRSNPVAKQTPISTTTAKRGRNVAARARP